MSDLFKSIEQGLKEAVLYEEGKLTAKTVVCTVNPVKQFAPAEIKSIRNSLNMTQNTFANVMGVSIKTVEAWESGTNKPIGPARRMLGILQIDSTVPKKYDIVS